MTTMKPHINFDDEIMEASASTFSNALTVFCAERAGLYIRAEDGVRRLGLREYTIPYSDMDFILTLLAEPKVQAYIRESRKVYLTTDVDDSDSYVNFYAIPKKWHFEDAADAEQYDIRIIEMFVVHPDEQKAAIAANRVPRGEYIQAEDMSDAEKAKLIPIIDAFMKGQIEQGNQAMYEAVHNL